MYYEERVINGRTEFRTHPDGAWKPLPAWPQSLQALAMEARITELEEALTAISTNTLDAARAKQVADEVLYEEAGE